MGRIFLILTSLNATQPISLATALDRDGLCSTRLVLPHPIPLSRVLHTSRSVDNPTPHESTLVGKVEEKLHPIDHVLKLDLELDSILLYLRQVL